MKRTSGARELPFGRRIVTAAALTAATCALTVGACAAGTNGAWPADAADSGAATVPSVVDGGPRADGAPTLNSGDGGEEAGAPFVALSVTSYVTKVKNLLTGGSPTAAEIAAVTADPSALGGLVDGWMKDPAYTTLMEQFFGQQFQQNQLNDRDFQGFEDNRFTPEGTFLQTLRVSFAKTVTELIAEGRPFTETATTTRFMLTTAQMVRLAYGDSSMAADTETVGFYGLRNRFYMNDPNWSFSFTEKTAIPFADSVNPASPNYLMFSLPSGVLTEALTPPSYRPSKHSCVGWDPLVYSNASAYGGGNNMLRYLYSYLQGSAVPQISDIRPNEPHVACDAADYANFPPLLTDADYDDWRMVTINAASPSAPQTVFFDLPAIRATSALNLYTPRVGYFTTEAFLAQYLTNLSNQARVTANQTMIIGLGQAFDGTDPITVADAGGIDPVHDSNPQCFACHWNLDPMARFFRSNYTVDFSLQMDPAQTSVPGTFLFDGMTGSGSTLQALGNAIASHANFKTAWTAKLCAWANSAPCLTTDPEVQRVAGVFAASGYLWPKLVHELFTSPLVTYSAPTATAAANGAPVVISRRGHLCGTLSARLHIPDICGLAAYQAPSAAFTVPTTSATLPDDLYNRGQVDPVLVNAPDPFFESTVENTCAAAADRVVDAKSAAGSAPLFDSSTPAVAIAAMVHDFMAVLPPADATPIAVLTTSFNTAQAGGATATVALKSTFTLACMSPYVASLGL